MVEIIYGLGVTWIRGFSEEEFKILEILIEGSGMGKKDISLFGYYTYDFVWEGDFDPVQLIDELNEW